MIRRGKAIAYLSFDVLLLILVIVRLHGELELLDELLLGVLVWKAKQAKWLYLART